MEGDTFCLILMGFSGWVILFRDLLVDFFIGMNGLIVLKNFNYICEGKR